MNPKKTVIEVELEQEVDGRWIADAKIHSSAVAVLAYGPTQDAAIASGIRILADQLDQGTPISPAVLQAITCLQGLKASLRTIRREGSEEADAHAHARCALSDLNHIQFHVDELKGLISGSGAPAPIGENDEDVA